MITVRELMEDAFPPGTTLATGEIALDREVTWATRPRPNPPAFGHLRGGELVLLGGSALANLDERITLEAAVRRLAGFGVAAIAYVGRASMAARSAAVESGIAFIQLPSGADLSALEREASHLILERRRDLQRKSQEAGRRLMELAIGGESLAVITQVLSEITSQSVALEGRDRRLHLFQQATPRSPSRAVVESLLQDTRDELSGWLRDAVASSSAEPPTTLVTLGDSLNRLIAPIIGRDGLLGTLSLIGSNGMETGELAQLASRGAAACAVVMTREYATLAARREIEINVLDEVLDGALRSEISLLQQAKRLGHDLNEAHVVLVSKIEPSASAGKNRDSRWDVFDEIMSRQNRKLLWRIRHNSAEILWPVVSKEEAIGVTDRLFADMGKRLEGTSLEASMGVGRVATGLAGIQQSHQEAKQSLTMGRRLRGSSQLTRFEDLGVYRLIFAAEQLDELRAFREEAIGSLVAYDHQHNADLVNTLRAFFDAKCGPKEAAAALEVHRNTVLYRLERVREITGLDLDDADVRLRLHLALCVDLAVGANGG